MIANIHCLVEAAKRKNLPVSFHDKNRNFVTIAGRHFVNAAVPFNGEDVHRICKDKEFSYQLLHESVAMPLTRGYFDPKRSEHSEYISFPSIESIAHDIAANFAFPLIVKRNAGHASSNVFSCRDKEGAAAALTQIFNEQSRRYDYCALAQTKIDIRREYRAVTLFGEIVLTYFWQDGKAVLDDDAETRQKIQRLLNPVFSKLDIKWCGFDVAEDTDGKLWVIELNSQPGFEHFVKHSGTEPLVEVYEKMLTKMYTESFVAINV